MAKKESTAVRLRRLRESKGLSPAQLSERCGVSRAALYRLELAGESHPRMSTLAALANYYRLTIGQVRGTEPLAGGK
jgi:transcriptional regulator with XRE-family HTH domain